MSSSGQRASSNLYLVTALLAAICIFKLAISAAETGNWHGAWISIAHVVSVAVGGVLALR